MNEVFTGAPGKAFICGEFVALSGAPAIVAAVDRHVRVRRIVQAGDRWQIRSSYQVRERIATTAELMKAPARGASSSTRMEVG